VIEIVLLGKPVAKGRPRFNTETGVAYTPEKTAKYETQVKYVAAQVMGGRPPMEGPLTVEIDIVVPIPVSWPKKKQADARSGVLRPTGKPDLDNLQKGLFDAANMVVWVDDSQIVDVRATKFYGDKPRAVMRVSSCEPQPVHNGVFE